MYSYARVCSLRPCYSARVSATLPLVEEGKFRYYLTAPEGTTHSPHNYGTAPHDTDIPQPPELADTNKFSLF